MSRDTHRYLREELFERRPVVGIYGTSVSGISFQKPYETDDDYRIIYIPCQPYVVLEAIDSRGDLVAYGEEGEVRCFRFTADQLIPGFVERDRGVRIRPFGAWKDAYPWDWLGDPNSPSSLSGQKVEGVY
jgi:thienamycin biosynthesis protein ThnN